MGPRALAWYFSRRDLSMTLEGGEHLPPAGPVLIAARHYHHLYDGATLVMLLPRMVHIFVALDWVGSARDRRIMEWACASARWPVALRRPADGNTAGGFSRDEQLGYVRRSLRDAARLLVEGRVLAVFPEGFPTIEPFERRTRADGELLAFQAGFVSIAALAQRESGVRVPILPAAFVYRKSARRYRVTLRLGAPLYLEPADSRAQTAAEVARRVKLLCELD